MIFSAFLDYLAHLFHPRKSNNFRARFLHLEVLVSMSLLMIGVAAGIHQLSSSMSKFGAVLGYASSITAEQVIDQTNQERKKDGLVPLTQNDRLTAAALSKAQHMFNNQYWAHVSPDGTEPWSFIKSANYSYVLAGENLARDFSTTPEMVSAWMRSPTHKDNIVNPKYSETGIAVVSGTLQGVETTLVVQLFGKPQTGLAAVIPAIPPAQLAQASTPQKSLAADQAVQGADELNSTLIVLSPIQLMKAVFLALIMLLCAVIIYDSFVAKDETASKFAGQNFGHIIFLSVVGYLLLYFSGGLVG